MTPSTPDPSSLRSKACGLIIAIAFALACGRIVSAQRVYEPAFHRDTNKQGDRRPLWPTARPNPMPTFSSNDRSRWATVRALVHDHTYVVGKRDRSVVVTSAVGQLGADDLLEAAVLAQAGYFERTTSQDGIIFEDGWQTIDAVLDPSTLLYYSSKPPLLSTLVAGIYWLVHAIFGWSLIVQPASAVRAVLLLVNALPFAGYLWLLARVAEIWGKTDWGRIYIVAAGAFATLVTPFLIALNNHTIGTFSVMAAWYSTLEIWRHLSDEPTQTPPWRHFVSAGFFGAFSVTNELPSLSFATAIFVLLLWWRPRQTLIYLLPAALIPAVAFFATNYAAIGMWKPAYAEFKGPWYQFEGSHWKILPTDISKKGIDFAKNVETRPQYAMHLLVGHHGVFSLTPIWILALLGMLAGSWRWSALRRQAFFREKSEFPWFVQPLGLGLTIVVAGFYIFDESRNYGGFTNGLRWMMWLTPIWLTCLLPVADRLSGSCTGRWFAVVLLAISVFSASYQFWNPWRHPWIYDMMVELGWPGY